MGADMGCLLLYFPAASSQADPPPVSKHHPLPDQCSKGRQPSHCTLLEQVEWDMGGVLNAWSICCVVPPAAHEPVVITAAAYVC